ncbi:SDR family NAD(P)-dependent oxidoreductase [Hellea balneolensis]|uniref:SDR family NAD(P)-dependent oxidoreductase n=1 Tax=Hellea balneolensis TaxID=287478 RepID=UPI00041B18AC|nr:SDR family NAD(P)-dependent oxidoreductase [Hellea balneolensis]
MASSDQNGNKPLCLITGASAGIGAAIAKEYALRGWDLALCARREAPMVALATELKQEYGTTSHIFEIDLFDPNATDNLISRMSAKGLHIDGLVNNAGYGHPGVYLESEWDDHAKFIQLMMTAPCELARKLAPAMVENGFGRIINVASLAGHMPGSKGHTLYAAVKSFLIKFSQSLNMELDGSGVHVSALCPGFTYTEFHDVNGTREAMNKLPAYMMMEADECAEMGVEACERNRAVFVPGGVNKTIATLGKVLPNSIAQSLMAKNSEKFRKID